MKILKPCNATASLAPVRQENGVNRVLLLVHLALLSVVDFIFYSAKPNATASHHLPASQTVKTNVVEPLTDATAPAMGVRLLTTART